MTAPPIITLIELMWKPAKSWAPPPTTDVAGLISGSPDRVDQGLVPTQQARNLKRLLKEDTTFWIANREEFLKIH